jgi:hypothetical protein
MKKVKLVEKEYVYYIFVDGEFASGGEKMNDLFAGRSWDMFEQTIHTFENLKRELGFELEIERLPNSQEYIGKANLDKGNDIFYHFA